MQTVEVAIKPVVKITLKPDTEVLDEVVVTGYGNFKKSSFTGAASSITTEKLQDVPSLSVQDKLAGSVAGVQITSTSGQPGAVESVRIRGMGSINAGNDPLYVIDGVPVMTGDASEFTYSQSGNSLLSTINSNDIESMTVIKDAAAASLYGSRAANGVIVITTKKGASGKLKLNVRADWGFSLPDMSVVFKNPSDIILLGLSVAGVVMAQTLLATNNYANKYGYKVSNNREILSYAAANAASAVIGGCPLNGSVSRTGIADQFGCKSQVMSITASLTMLLIVLFGTPVLEYLPVPILTGIVVAALIGITEFGLAVKLWKTDHTEFAIFVGAFLGVLLFGTIYGVVIGVILSFIAVIVKAVEPPRAFLGVITGQEGFYSLNRYRNVKKIKGAVIYRFNGALFFANINTFVDDIEKNLDDNTKWVIVDAGGVGSIDVTAVDRLMSLYKALEKKEIRFYITEHEHTLNDQLRELGAGELVEKGVVRRTIPLALRDAGLDRPYPVEDGEEEQVVSGEVHEDNERLAEIEWAFGADADEWLEKMAAEMADEIGSVKKDEKNVIVDAEKHAAWGRIGLFDENDLLERLEMHLFDDKKYPNLDIDDIEKRIDERRVVVEKKLAQINPDAIQMLKEHRKEMLDRLKLHNPYAYEHMMEQKRKHYEHLKKKDPELAQKLKNFYNLSGDDK